MKIILKGSHLLALAITAGIGFWMYNGEVKIGGQNPSESLAQSDGNLLAETIDQQAVDAEQTLDELFKVSYVTLSPQERTRTVSVRGRTKPDAIIPVRSETGGILRKRLVNRGQRVNEGDLVCQIDAGAREAAVLSARAALTQAQVLFDANKDLSEKGFASKNTMPTLKAQLNSAKAQLREAEIELDRINVRANASGVVQDPIAETGDVLQPGGTCITLVDSDPMFFTGQISEEDVGDVETGMEADVMLVSNESATGVVTYIAPTADEDTRTFATEIRLKNNGKKVHAGVTAQANIKLPTAASYPISPSWITLADSGEVGVKVVNGNDIIDFLPAKIVARSKEGFWLEGEALYPEMRVVTLGQEYVGVGEKVQPIKDPIQTAEVQQ